MIARFMPVGVRYPIAIFLADFLLSIWSRLFVFPNEHIATIWLATGIAVGALHGARGRERYTLLAAVFAASLCAALHAGFPLAIAVGISVAHSVEGLMGAVALERIRGQHIRFDSIHDIVALVFGVAVASNACASLIAASVISAGFDTSFSHVWKMWWLSNGFGILAVAPLACAVRAFRSDQYSRATLLHGLEVVSYIVGITAGSFIIFGRAPDSRLTAVLPFVITPALIWVGYRCRVIGGSLAFLSVAVVATWATQHHLGTFANPHQSTRDQIIEVQIFTLVALVSPLVAAVLANERTHITSQLQDSETRYRELFANARDVIFVIERDGTLVEINAAIEIVSGWTAREVIGKPVFELVSSENREELRSVFQRIWNGEPFAPAHFDVIGRQGQLKRFEIIGRVIRHGGRPRWIEGTARDVTERIELETQLRAIQRLEAVGQLAGGIAHDMNNILQAIAVSAELGGMRAETPQQEQRFKDISGVVERGSSIIQQLLAFARRQISLVQHVDVNSCIDSAQQILRRLIPENIAFEVSRDPRSPTVLADPAQIVQIIMNLVVNSRDAMPEGGHLRIATESLAAVPTAFANIAKIEGAVVAIRVEDTGMGMDEATRSRIFEPFFTTKPAGVGTGLGLSTVYGIVKQARGFVFAESAAGMGTTMHLFFPAAGTLEKNAIPEIAQPSNTVGREIKTKTVLLVEDEQQLRSALEEALSSVGHKVFSAPNAAEALDLARRVEGRIDAVITDMVMPGMSGSALIERLRRTRPPFTTIIMSGYSDALVEGATELLNRGDSYFIQKPFPIANLLAILQGAVRIQ